MMRIIDKRDRARLSVTGWSRRWDRTGITQAALARRPALTDQPCHNCSRDQGARLPNAQLVAECSAALGVSADWLLGLSDFPNRPPIWWPPRFPCPKPPAPWAMTRSLPGTRRPQATRSATCHRACPICSKTTDMLRWEYAPAVGKTIEQAIGASADRLGWMQQSKSDYEIALPLSELDSFARGQGYYAGLPVNVRQDQLRRFRDLHDQLYPALRLHLFDKRAVYSAPVTVFGPLLAVIYRGAQLHRLSRHRTGHSDHAAISTCWCGAARSARATWPRISTR